MARDPVVYWQRQLENWGIWSNDGLSLHYSHVDFTPSSAHASAHELHAQRVEALLVIMSAEQRRLYRAVRARYLRNSDDISAADYCQTTLPNYLARLDRACLWLERNQQRVAHLR
jgi:hypothetical protein